MPRAPGGLIPARSVVARAPVRVADVGGWTDTWFGSPGQVCSLAVGPGVEVAATLVARGTGDELPVRLVSSAVGLDGRTGPSDDGWAFPLPGEHPLLEHAVGTVLESVALPDDVGIEITISGAVPAGASLGTSAAVVVAILGSLDALVAGGERSPAELARLAHWVETVAAGRESGVQDQWSAVMGGCGLLAVGPYPEARHEVVELSSSTVRALGRRLVTVVFEPHDSSTVHHEVIHLLTACGGAEHDRARHAMRRLAALAAEAASALEHADVDRWAGILSESTEVQGRLHPGLVGPAHHAAIEVARSLGATGWKVNGAGGAGGSLTVIAANRAGAAADLAAALSATDPAWRVVDLTPAPGLSVTNV